MTSMDEHQDRQARIAKNQSLFREINERIESLNESLETITHSSEWICECADLTCIEKIEMPLDEYERIRQHPDRFPVKRGHEVPDVEKTVEQHDGYLVVEKVGVAGEVARRYDPRA
ncbi:MAG: hypothetical protein QOH15_1260 [Gaiellales bacterium]|jgi:hypothetical protein|nr:hypothetical protein [Gaiellales bacterium]